MPRIAPLDGLRGVAILLVLVWHCSEFYKPEPGSFGASVVKILQTTWSGVDLFFVLSGFLIGGILIDNRGVPNSWKTFILRRSLRILPLYFIVLATYLFLLPIRVSTPWLLSDILPAWSYATFTQNLAMGYTSNFGANYLGPTWSLAVEEQFYFFMPLLVRFTPKQLLAPALVLIIIASVICRMAIYHWWSAHHYLAVYVLMPCRADALLLGVLCAILYRSSAWQATKNRAEVILAFLTVCVVLISALSGSLYSKPMIFGGYTLLALFYSAILIRALSEEGIFLNKLLSWKPLRDLGGIAFAVYLFHIPVLGITHTVIFSAPPAITNLSNFSATLLAVVITIALAKFSWFALEKRAIELGHRFSTRVAVVSANPIV